MTGAIGGVEAFEGAHIHVADRHHAPSGATWGSRKQAGRGPPTEGGARNSWDGRVSQRGCRIVTNPAASMAKEIGEEGIGSMERGDRAFPYERQSSQR